MLRRRVIPGEGFMEGLRSAGWPLEGALPGAAHVFRRCDPRSSNDQITPNWLAGFEVLNFTQQEDRSGGKG